MNREQKAAAIEALASEIKNAQAIFAVDYRGLSVPQAAELRAKLREAEATFTVVKNSLTERAADQVGTEELKSYLTGPTALTFVRGDAALAAKAIADYARVTQLLPFKGGVMDGAALDAEQIRAISRLPSREVLYGQLVGIVASPVSGLVRTLNALLGGLAVALGQVHAKKESGEIPAGDAPATEPEAKELASESEATAAPAGSEAEAVQAATEETPAEAPAAAESEATEASTESEAETASEPQAEAAPAEAESQAATEEAPAEAPEADESAPEHASAEKPQGEQAPAEEASVTEQAEPAEPAQDDNKNASEQEPDSAEATKED